MGIHNICVLGGTGFVGRHVVTRLVNDGCAVTVLTRRQARHRELLVLPGLEIAETDVYSAEQLQRRFAGFDAVINLVGILNESGHRGSGFEHAHVKLTETVLRACRDTGVGRLLHMSALNADASNGPSHYLRTKGEAENKAHAFAPEQIAVTSFRPSVIFGPQDSFFNRFAGLLAISPWIFPLACPQARFAPVYVGDVADAFVNALSDRAAYGQRINLCGPHEYSLAALVEYTASVMALNRRIVGLPDWLSGLQAAVLEFAPGKPFSRDNYKSLARDSTCPGGATCPTSLESVVPYYLGPRGREARYNRFRARYRD